MWIWQNIIIKCISFVDKIKVKWRTVKWNELSSQSCVLYSKSKQLIESDIWAGHKSTYVQTFSWLRCVALSHQFLGSESLQPLQSYLETFAISAWLGLDLTLDKGRSQKQKTTSQVVGRRPDGSSQKETKVNFVICGLDFISYSFKQKSRCCAGREFVRECWMDTQYGHRQWTWFWPNLNFPFFCSVRIFTLNLSVSQTLSCLISAC